MSIVTSKTASTTLPPPTINSLSSSQRARLLKSSRKLENLLGATPQVVESDLPFPATRNATLRKKSKSQHISVSNPTASPVMPSINSAESHESSGLVPAASRSSQNAIARKHSKHKSVHLPRPLVLHLNNVSPVPKPNIRIEHSESSPGSAQVLTLPPPAIPMPSPLSPLFPSEDESMQVPQEKIRRRRMAKLTRTLGENIPTEFILPHDHFMLSQHQRSPSEPTPRSLWPDWSREESGAAFVITNNTTSTTLPPPTINSLGPSQRARLLKSTRKLENLLGATPQVVESAVLPRTRTNSTHIVFPVSEKRSKHKSMQLPRPLVLHHNKVPAVAKLDVRIEQPLSADSAQVLTLPRAAIATPSPLSSLFAMEDEPTTPMDVPQEKIRRKRMAKLTRTLGENIPSEFILTHDHLKLSQHQRSPSEPSPHSLWPDWERNEGEGTAVLHSHPKRRSQTASVVDSNPTIVNATTVPSRHSKSVVIRRRPTSVGSEIVFSSKLFTVTSSSPEGPSSFVNPSDSETTEDNDVDVVGSDWCGEWNIKDGQERAMALRNLRSY